MQMKSKVQWLHGTVIALSETAERQITQASEDSLCAVETECGGSACGASLSIPTIPSIRWAEEVRK